MHLKTIAVWHQQKPAAESTDKTERQETTHRCRGWKKKLRATITNDRMTYRKTFLVVQQSYDNRLIRGSFAIILQENLVKT